MPIPACRSGEINLPLPHHLGILPTIVSLLTWSEAANSIVAEEHVDVRFRIFFCVFSFFLRQADFQIWRDGEPGRYADTHPKSQRFWNSGRPSQAASRFEHENCRWAPTLAKTNNHAMTHVNMKRLYIQTQSCSCCNRWISLSPNHGNSKH